MSCHHPMLIGLVPILFGLAGCPPSTALPVVVDVRDVSAAGGDPDITRVVDIGTGKVPSRGRLGAAAKHHDGYAVIGELLLIQGSSFGKQPRVSIGGRAAAVLAHVKGGGVIARVPWGIDPGEVDVEVSHPSGRSSVKFPVRRMGLVLTEAGLDTFEVKADGEIQILDGKRVTLAGGQHIAFSHDGSVAYVGGVAGSGRVTVWVVDLTGPAPKVITEQRFPGSRLVDIETAAQSWLGLVVTDTHLAYFDNRPMLNPAFYKPHKLPDELTRKQILAAAVGGQGQRVALLLSDLNQVAVLAAGDPTRLTKARVADVLPEVRLQVVNDLRFSGDGTSIWVVSSDTDRSIASGYQPAQLTLLQVGTDGTAKVHLTWGMGEKLGAPMLAIARGEPIPPGTAIRAEPSSSEVYAPSYPSDLLKDGFSALLKQPDKLKGRLLRSSLNQKSAKVVGEGSWLLTSVDVVGQTEVLVALGCSVKGGKLTRVLVHGKAWRGGAPKVRELGPAPASLLERRPPWLGVVRAQP